jgi:hypothetical protein
VCEPDSDLAMAPCEVPAALASLRCESPATSLSVNRRYPTPIAWPSVGWVWIAGTDLKECGACRSGLG